MAQGIKIYNDTGTASTTLDFGNPNSDRTVALDTMLSDIEAKANTADLKEIGVGQTWQDVTASRSLDTTYTNTTGKPIVVQISCTNTQGGKIVVNGVTVGLVINTFTGSVQAFASAIVPNGATYRINTFIGEKPSLIAELR